MSFTVSQESKDKASRCPFDFQCLSDEKFPICSVGKEINDYGFFIKDTVRTGNCSHRISYGFAHICRCPVRMEIFKKYNR